MRAFKTVMAIVFGGIAFFFFFMSFEQGVGQVPSMVLFVACSLLAFAFGRRTAADRERIARWKQKASAWVDAVSGAMCEPTPERQRDPLKRTLVGATVLHVLASPFLVLRGLLKMQK